MRPELWKGRRVLLTGHTGFKGAWLALLLERLGAEVTGFALAPPTQPSLFELARAGEALRDLRGDVRDLPAVRRAVDETKPEIVIHTAAQSLVRTSYEEPVATYATNVMGTVHVLEAARHAPSVRAVLVVTSDKCYENREWVWGYRENEPMGGSDPYSSSKGCAELVTGAYRASFFQSGAAVASARAGNVIGGGDWAPNRLLPDAARAFSAGRPLEVRNPRAVRPWQHVLEPLSGYVALAEALQEDGAAFAGAWNFGPADEDARTVGDVVERFTQLWGGGARWEATPGVHPHEAHLLRLDCAKARTVLGWRPRTRLDEALQWTADWYGSWRRGVDMREFTREQIERYLSMEQ